MAAPAFTIDEYLAFTSGNYDEAPPRARVNTPYKTDYHEETGDLFAVFKVYMVSGIEYEVFMESSYTLEDFDASHACLIHWKPSDFVTPIVDDDIEEWGQTYMDETDEDVAPFSEPYDYILNFDSLGDWLGGRRYKFTPDETGYHVFMAYDYTLR
ncbi:MAG TPA: hypothetical protein VMV77_16795 [Bacteroidales bacterium]|nr:hypothetical protein [Bacteroidales bacterium]